MSIPDDNNNDTRDEVFPRLRLRNVNILQEKKKALTAMSKAISHLLKTVHEEGKLTRDDHHALANYIKIIKELEQIEKDELDGLTTEELEQKAKDTKR